MDTAENGFPTSILSKVALAQRAWPGSAASQLCDLGQVLCSLGPQPFTCKMGIMVSFVMIRMMVNKAQGLAYKV